MKKLQHNSHSERAENDAGCTHMRMHSIHVYVSCMHVCMCIYACAYECIHASSFFQDAPHGSAVFVNKNRTLRTEARCCSNFSGRSARERDFHKYVSRRFTRERDFFKIFRTLRTGARFFSKFWRRSAQEREFFKIFRTPRTGAQFFSKCSRRSSRERDFDHKRTIWSGSI